MKTIAYLDCPTGISGDMCLGAVVSAGVPVAYLESAIAQLNLPETVQLQAQTVQKNGLAATKVEVVLPHETASPTHVHPPARHLREIEQILTSAALPEQVLIWSLAIFRRLAIAEGAIHGIEPEAVHFHEVGATDAIVDIVGTCLGLDWLGVEAVFCSPLPMGQGTVRAAHGRLPIPAPAVLKLMAMAQVSVYGAGLPGELVTPTGAAIATELATQFGEPPPMCLQTIGLGAGTQELALPNVLRLWLGKAIAPITFHADTHTHRDGHGSPFPASKPVPSETLTALVTAFTSDREERYGEEQVMVLETQVDDLSPQAIGYVYERLLAVGALDVFTQNVTMKKSRPGHLITVIVYPEMAATCEQILLRETTTLGVRRIPQIRLRLQRQLVSVTTPLGIVRMKLAFLPGQNQLLKAHPEYEDCAAIAQAHDLPWREVHTLAMTCWQQQMPSSTEAHA